MFVDSVQLSLRSAVCVSINNNSRSRDDSNFYVAVILNSVIPVVAVVALLRFQDRVQMLCVCVCVCVCRWRLLTA